MGDPAKEMSEFNGVHGIHQSLPINPKLKGQREVTGPTRDPLRREPRRMGYVLSYVLEDRRQYGCQERQVQEISDRTSSLMWAQSPW